MSTEPPKNAKAAAKDATSTLPFEVAEQIEALTKFLAGTKVDVPDHTRGGTRQVRLGSVQWGVYAFFDYDDEPIYVGQTRESLGGRIGRHLTGRRSDAVAKKILDPFEVCTVRVYPLPQFQGRKAGEQEPRETLDALEYKVFEDLLGKSKFGAVLNEKAPPTPKREVEIPASYEGRIATEKIMEMRDHPDIRIARRAQTLAALATIISERRVGKGIRVTLLTQAKRLQWLAERRAMDAPDAGPEEEGEES